MKITRCIFYTSLAVSVQAFGTLPLKQRNSFAVFSEATTTTTTESDFASAMPTANSEDLYASFGITENQLAYGVDIQVLVKCIGTKDDLVRRVMKDMKLSRQAAEQETDKFLLDMDMVNALLFYEMNKEAIEAKLQSDGTWRNVLALYAVWFFSSTVFPAIRRNVIDPKVEAGEWPDYHPFLQSLPIIGSRFAEEASSVTLQNTAEAAQSAVQAASDALTNAM